MNFLCHNRGLRFWRGWWELMVVLDGLPGVEAKGVERLFKKIVCRFYQNRVIIEGFADRSGVCKEVRSDLNLFAVIVKNIQPISVGV